MSDPKCGVEHDTEIGGEAITITCLAPPDHTGMHRYMTHGGALISWPNKETCDAVMQAPDGPKVCVLKKRHGSPHMDATGQILWLPDTTTVLTEREKGREFDRPAWRDMFRDQVPERARDVVEQPAEVRDQPAVARSYAQRKKKGRR